jgi:hypothetical protein
MFLTLGPCLLPLLSLSLFLRTDTLAENFLNVFLGQFYKEIYVPNVQPGAEAVPFQLWWG